MEEERTLLTLSTAIGPLGLGAGEYQWTEGSRALCLPEPNGDADRFVGPLVWRNSMEADDGAGQVVVPGLWSFRLVTYDGPHARMTTGLYVRTEQSGANANGGYRLVATSAGGESPASFPASVPEGLVVRAGQSYTCKLAPTGPTFSWERAPDGGPHCGYVWFGESLTDPPSGVESVLLRQKLSLGDGTPRMSWLALMFGPPTTTGGGGPAYGKYACYVREQGGGVPPAGSYGTKPELPAQPQEDDWPPGIAIG
jgi:hypothetical protein